MKRLLTIVPIVLLAALSGCDKSPVGAKASYGKSASNETASSTSTETSETTATDTSVRTSEPVNVVLVKAHLDYLTNLKAGDVDLLCKAGSDDKTLQKLRERYKDDTDSASVAALADAHGARVACMAHVAARLLKPSTGWPFHSFSAFDPGGAADRMMHTQLAEIIALSDLYRDAAKVLGQKTNATHDELLDAAKAQFAALADDAYEHMNAEQEVSRDCTADLAGAGQPVHYICDQFDVALGADGYQLRKGNLNVFAAGEIYGQKIGLDVATKVSVGIASKTGTSSSEREGTTSKADASGGL